FVIPQAEAIVAGRDDAVARHRLNLVPGELFANELIVRFVGIERANDVVAVFPRVRLRTVALETVGLGEANEIKPMPAPVLAVMPRVEQPINDFLIPVA